MAEPRPGVAAIEIADDPATWEAAGFTVGEDGDVLVATTRLRLVGAREPRGVRSWTLRADGRGALDGLPTRWEPADTSSPPPAHPNGVIAIDHVVVGSPDRDRTVAAIRAGLGLEPRRQTEHELAGRATVQTFYVLDDLVLEVISRPDERSPAPSVFWGLAFTVPDLDATARLLGDRLGSPREAVQPGRRIATLRSEQLGVSVPVAFLSPRPR